MRQLESEVIRTRTLYLAAFTAEGEVTAPGYARVPFTMDLSEDYELKEPVHLAKPAATWGFVDRLVAMDAPDGGNELFFVCLDPPIVASPGNGVTLGLGAGRIRIA